MNLQSIFKDTIITGAVAGSTAGIVMEIINYPLYYLEYLSIRPIDFAYMVITHSKAQGLGEIIAGLINHLLFASLSGIALSYILRKTDYRLPILKGIGIGLGTNIILLVLASFFNIKQVVNISTANILLLDASAALPFGITLGFSLNYLHNLNRNYR